MKGMQNMKKSNLIASILYLMAGIACLLTALFTESKLEGLLWGFSGAGIGPGILMICKYFYWSSPKHKARYQERLENEKIELHDELKEKLRDRSGRYAYILGLLVISISMVVFSVLEAFEMIGDSRMIVLYLGGYLAFQLVIYVVFFNRLAKQY